MTENTYTHWTDDEELLEKFVLRQLSSVEEQRLSSHLVSCEKCRLAVKEETRIAAGTKFAGRKDMKERLKTRLEHGEQGAVRPGYQIQWMRIASLAAVVVVLVAVGVYNNWFGVNYRSAAPEQLVQEQKQSSTETTGKETRESSQDMLKQKDLGQSSSIPDKDRLDKAEPYRAERLRKSAGADKRDAGDESAVASPRRNTGAGVATGQTPKAENKVGLEDQAMTPASQVYWVEGNLSSEVTPRDRMREKPSAAEEEPALATGRVEAKVKRNAAQLSAEGTPIQFTLKQEPSSSLPPVLQTRQNRTGMVQALIESRANSLQMTLYLDSLVEDSALKSAEVNVVGEDSIILSFANQRIGYKLPLTLQGQVNTKAKR